MTQKIKQIQEFSKCPILNSISDPRPGVSHLPLCIVSNTMASISTKLISRSSKQRGPEAGSGVEIPSVPLEGSWEEEEPNRGSRCLK